MPGRYDPMSAISRILKRATDNPVTEFNFAGGAQSADHRPVEFVIYEHGDVDDKVEDPCAACEKRLGELLNELEVLRDLIDEF